MTVMKIHGKGIQMVLEFVEYTKICSLAKHCQPTDDGKNNELDVMNWIISFLSLCDNLPLS
jgi:hypothetical protein